MVRIHLDVRKAIYVFGYSLINKMCYKKSGKRMADELVIISVGE